ncbi:unnamed protein product, partial [Leptidea sinapis]
MNLNNVSKEILLGEAEDSLMVMCGVCGKEMENFQWITHIQADHRYLAWKDGDTPLDVNDSMQVRSHLETILEQHERLLCPNCKEMKHNVNRYLEHVENCQIGNDDGVQNPQDIFVCAICGAKGMQKDWRSHAINSHYNVAWYVGGDPI